MGEGTPRPAATTLEAVDGRSSLEDPAYPSTSSTGTGIDAGGTSGSLVGLPG